MRSSKSIWLRLKPFVLTFAILLAVLSTSVCCAFKPVAAVKSALIMMASSQLETMREQTLSLRTSAELKRIGEGPQGTLGGFGVTHAGDHRDHLVHHFDIGSLSIALLHRARSGLGLNTIGC